MKTLTLLLAILFPISAFGGLAIETEEHARSFLKESQLVVTGAIETVRPIAYFDKTTGVYLGSTKAEARKSSPTAAFAMVTYAADVRVDEILYTHHKDLTECKKVSVVWSDLTAIVDNAGIASGCPEVTHHARQSHKRLWFLSRSTGVWKCLIDVDPGKLELTKKAIEPVATDTNNLPDPFQDLVAVSPQKRSDGQTEKIRELWRSKKSQQTRDTWFEVLQVGDSVLTFPGLIVGKEISYDSVSKSYTLRAISPSRKEEEDTWDRIVIVSEDWIVLQKSELKMNSR